MAVSLIAGSLIAVDSASIGLLRERLDSIPVDYYGYGYNYPSEIDVDKSERVKESLLAVDGVESASYIATLTGWRFLNTDGDRFDSYTDYWLPSGSVLFLPEDSSTLMERYKIDGVMPEPGTAAVSLMMAAALGIEPGDDIICSYEVPSWDYLNETYLVLYVNMSFEVSQIWDQAEGLDQEWQWWYSDGEVEGDVTIIDNRNPVMLNFGEVGAVRDAINELTPATFSEVYFVWIDRDEFLSLGNIYMSVELLETLNGRLERAAREADVRFTSPLVSVLWELGDDMSQKKVIFIGLSLPVVVLGLYLSVVGVDMGMTDRRREVGILKSRGASNRQVFGSLMSESLILGVIAGLAGLGLGVVLSRFLMFAVSGLFGADAVEQGISSFMISWSTLGSVVALGVVLMIFSCYRPMKRASRTLVAEALHHYAPKSVKVEYKAKYDIAALFLVGLSVVSVLWLNSWIPRWHVGSFIVYFVIVVLMLVGVAIVPVVPFLLSASITRLVTRGSRKLYTRFTWLVKPWTKELHYIVEKNIARNPKRASNIGMIVSLAVAFGLFVSITMESELAYAERSVFYEVGADIRYEGYSYYDGMEMSPVNYSLLETVDSLEGVERSAMFVTATALTDFQYSRMAIFDPEEIAGVLDIGSGWYEGDGSRDIRDLEQNGTAFVSQAFADSEYLVVGDTLHMEMEVSKDMLNYTTETVVFNLEVIGMVEQLPGLWSELYVDEGTMSWVEPEWYPPGATSVGFFVTVEDGADHSETAARVSALCGLAGLDGYYYVAEERLEEMTSIPEFRSIRDFLYLEYAMSLVMLTCGVGLVLFVTVWDRRQELACIMARGTSSNQMRRILMGESLSLMTLGMVVGVSVGILSAYLYNMLVYGQDSSAVPHGIVLSVISWAVVLSAIVSFVIASYLATYNAGKLKLAEVLRIRGG